ncbi:sulfatase [Planctomycetes bacterium Poly30]
MISHSDTTRRVAVSKGVASRSRRAGALALLFSIGALAGCGGKEADRADAPEPVATHSGLISRLITDAQIAGSTTESTVELAGFRLTEDNRGECPWTAQGGTDQIQARVRPPGGSKEKKDMLAALAIRGKGPKSFTHEFAFSRGECTMVQLFITCYGEGSENLRVVTLDEKGKVAEASEKITLSARPEPHLLEIVIPRSEETSTVRTGIRVEVEGQKAHAALLSMSAFNAPVQGLMPAVGEGGQIEVDHSMRFAAGLVEGAPWEVELACDGEAQGDVLLDMSFFLPAWAGSMARSTAVNVEYEGAEGPATVSVDVPKDARSSWSDTSVKLAGLKPGASSLRLSLVDKDPHTESVLLIGDAVVTQRSRQPKSILLITSDTHRADHMGLSRVSTMVDTPALDRLGRRGIYFADCQSTTNVTNPSHIAILSGIHPRDTQIVDNKTQLAQQVETLAEVFQSQGYRTFAAISTQHLEHAQSGLGQGFDRFESTGAFKRRGDQAVEQLEDWLAETDGVSTFAWLHLFDAHAPYDPPSAAESKATKGIAKGGGTLGLADEFVPYWIKSRGIENGDFVDALYRAEVDWVDEALMGLLGSERMKDAFVAFTADHGESLRTHNVYWDHAGLYLPMVDVPLIIAGPGVEALRSETTVQQIDVGRTLINLAGLENTTYPGRDLVRAAIDEAPDEPRFAIAAHGLQASVSAGSWFYVLDLRDYSTEKTPHNWIYGRGRLFDRRKGVNTEENLADENPELAQRMRDRLIEFLESASSEGLGKSGSIDEAAEANLKALGYAGFTARTDSKWWTRPEDKK